MLYTRQEIRDRLSWTEEHVRMAAPARSTPAGQPHMMVEILVLDRVSVTCWTGGGEEEEEDEKKKERTAEKNQW